MLRVQRGGHSKWPAEVLVMGKLERRGIVYELPRAGGGAAEEGEADEV